MTTSAPTHRLLPSTRPPSTWARAVSIGVTVAVLVGCLALTGCTGSSRAATPRPEDQARAVADIKSAILQIPHVTGVGPTYNPGGPLEPARLSLGVVVAAGQSPSPVPPEITRIVWTSTLAPLDYFDISVGHDPQDAQEIHVDLKNEATTDDLSRRYGPRP